MQLLRLFCVFFLAALCLATDSRKEILQMIADNKRMQESGLTSVVITAMKKDLREVAELCRDKRGCSDFACCSRTVSDDAKGNPLIMKLLREQWDDLYSDNHVWL